MVEMSLLEVIALAGTDRRAASAAAKALIVPYSGQSDRLQSYRDGNREAFHSLAHETPVELAGDVDFRFDPTWGFFLNHGGVSVMSLDAWYPRSWLRYSKGIHNGHMLDLSHNVIGNRHSGSICVMVGKMPLAEDIYQLKLAYREHQELTDDDLKMIGSEAYIYVEGDSFRPALKTKIPIDKQVSDIAPIVLVATHYAYVGPQQDRSRVHVLFPETLTR